MIIWYTTICTMIVAYKFYVTVVDSIIQEINSIDTGGINEDYL